MQRRLPNGVDVADELSGVGVVPLDVGEKLLDDGVVAAPARLVQRGLAALSSDESRSEYFSIVQSSAKIVFLD